MLLYMANIIIQYILVYENIGQYCILIQYNLTEQVKLLRMAALLDDLRMALNYRLQVDIGIGTLNLAKSVVPYLELGWVRHMSCLCECMISGKMFQIYHIRCNRFFDWLTSVPALGLTRFTLAVHTRSQSCKGQACCIKLWKNLPMFCLSQQIQSATRTLLQTTVRACSRFPFLINPLAIGTSRKQSAQNSSIDPQIKNKKYRKRIRRDQVDPWWCM